MVYTAQDGYHPTDGTTGLREAIAYAESLAVTITFDPSVFGKSLQTLVLIHGPLAITCLATITMAGPGAGLLMISAAGQGRDFTVQGARAVISDDDHRATPRMVVACTSTAARWPCPPAPSAATRPPTAAVACSMVVARSR